jgi:glycosyltransferase involved in cell wall biosynthesis
MHVLICSYEFGYAQGPEGICAMRLAHALVGVGARVTVVTSTGADEGPARAGMQVIRVESKCFRPEPVFRVVKRALGRLYWKDYHQFWQWRVARTRLPAGIDFVYGRCMPFSSGLAARRLAARLRKPFLVHFSDPLLSPWFTPPGLPLFLMRRLYEGVVSRASGVSFTTREAIGYSERTMGIALGEKAFVLNHVAPEARVLGSPPTAAGPVFLYAGRFYGRRGPDALLQGFALYRSAHPGATLRFVGAEASAIMEEADRLGIAGAVAVFPFTRDLGAHLAEADVLLAVDAADETPVFLSTKVVDYFVVDRRVLLVTPPGSPAARLAERAPGTALCVVETAAAIARGMGDLVAMQPGAEAFRERFLNMREFSGEVVATRLLRQAERARS